MPTVRDEARFYETDTCEAKGSVLFSFLVLCEKRASTAGVEGAGTNEVRCLFIFLRFYMNWKRQKAKGG